MNNMKVNIIFHVFFGAIVFGGAIFSLFVAIIAVEYKDANTVIQQAMLAGVQFFLSAVQFAYFYKELGNKP